MDSLKLPIDPRTLEACVSSRRLRSIELDGTLSYEEPKSSGDALTERLNRIWEEYPEGLMELTEAKLEGLEYDAQAIEDVEEAEEEEEVHDRSKPMAYNDMQKLRDVLFDQLNTARNELWYALELAKTLGSSSSFTIDAPPLPGQPHNNNKRSKTVTSNTISESTAEPPILPPGSYTATPASLPVKSQQSKILDMELSLAAKHQALDDCSALIDSAVEEMEVMAEAGGRFWRDLRQLKSGRSGRGRWAVVPKPDFARIMAVGEKAKDVVIPYAVDEAPVQLRTRCLAAFDLDPTKDEPLTFGARSYRRLKVTIRTETTDFRSALPDSEENSIEVSMENAQLEALDEEVYGEVRNDLSRHTSGVVTPEQALLNMDGRELVFELCDVRESRPAALASSPLCDLVLLATRLSLLQIHRRRKARLVGRAAPGMSILQPITHILQYQSTTESVRSVLDMFSSCLDRAGLRSRLEALHSVSDSGGLETVERLLAGEDCVNEISTIYNLEVKDCHGISIAIHTPNACRVTTSRATFPVADLGDLPAIIADDLSSQLLSYAETVLTNEVDEVYRSRLFMDELENTIHIDPDTILEAGIQAPFDKVTASARGTISSRYDPQESVDLPEWIGGIATSINSSM